MKTALVVIDVQNCFINDRTKNLPGKISKYIEVNKFDFVLFSRTINKNRSNFVKLLNWRRCFSSPDIDIHKSLQKYINKRNVFSKTAYSVFKSTKFLNFLKRNKIVELYLCGIDADACVLASAFEAFDLGYKVKVLMDLSLSSSGKEFDDAATEIIARNIQK